LLPPLQLSPRRHWPRVGQIASAEGIP
jgi:hypothetical protein